MRTLPGGEDWLLTPVAEGWCKYESLLDGTLGLEDIALMNDAIAVRSENIAALRRLEQSNGR
ncbi:hypothetical protein FOB47_02730 [Cupriavidus gilardii]|nr:hypothetical protein FOB47_02730 [Cupriavidus gilardii]